MGRFRACAGGHRLHRQRVAPLGHAEPRCDECAGRPEHAVACLAAARRLWPAPALKTAICLCHAGQLNGRPGKPRRYRCEDAIDQIGRPVSISEDIFDSYASKVWTRHSENLSRPTSYQQACELLGVTRRDSLEIVKRAYRKKVSECHPDKLAQQQVSERDRTLAKERLLHYQQAWELIKRHNTFRQP